MYFKNIQELLDKKNHAILSSKNSECNNIYGLKISIDFNLQILKDNEFQEVCNLIEKYSNLVHELYLPEINICALGDINRLQVLCSAICKCKTLESLDLYGIAIDKSPSKYLQVINKIFFECQNLKSLNLSWFPFNELKTKNIRDICRSIYSLPKLQKLNLFSTGFDKLNTPYFCLLCSAIKKSPKLQSVTLYQTELDRLTDKHAAILFKTISESKAIIYCNLEGVQPDYNKERWNMVKEILKTKHSLLKTGETENIFKGRILPGFQKKQIKRSKDLLSYDYDTDTKDGCLPEKEYKRTKRYSCLHH